MDARNALSQDPLDRELQEAMQVDPSTDFAARVRLRVANETTASASWMPGWAYVFGTAVVASAVAVVMTVSSRPQLSGAPGVVASRALAVPVATTPAAVIAPTPVSAASPALPRPQAASGVSRTTSAGLPPVLVPPGQEQAMRLFADAAWEQRVGLVPASTAVPDEPLEIAPIELAPVDVEPLPQMAALEGERP